MPDHATPPSTGSTAPSAAAPSPSTGAAPARPYVENTPPRGVYVRVFIYVVATHVLLAFMSLLMVIATSR
ncbi:UmuC protein [Streptomyces sp. NBRC 110611]|uniref:DUF6126 family protein n=1 Tax=Streptomyces sp. NBRC 110611 TaxID=1621259 RepID=UPI00082DCEAA|nr:DUF6126 family protein [Streptomyces sp. NBRC 110611]GAU67155.1 UmuC protein [Streptomyces sp. NBRC 110611]